MNPEMAADKLWNSQPSCTNYMFCILGEVDAELKVIIKGLLALVLDQDPKARVPAYQFDKYKGIQIEHIYIVNIIYIKVGVLNLCKLDQVPLVNVRWS